MNTVDVELGPRSYGIRIAGGLLTEGGSVRELSVFAGKKRCFLITDANVDGLYGEDIERLLISAGTLSVSKYAVPAGENSKSLSVMEKLYRHAASFGLGRDALVVALGGGVPGDIAGFFAASYMRGLDFIQIPTSLLAMVDSSVGGKTGVDLPEGKNLVGAFWQPKAVFIDPCFLKTLPKRELMSGLAEVLKYGVIRSPRFFSLIEENTSKLVALDMDFYQDVIAECCRIKAKVVSGDERESGQRAVLNYGHTFGHAVEAVQGYGDLVHGEAVALGMCMAADMAVRLGIFSPEEAARQEKVITALGLPSRVSGLDPEIVLGAMAKDKKKKDGALRFVLPEKIGQVRIEALNKGDCILESIRGRCD